MTAGVAAAGSPSDAVDPVVRPSVIVLIADPDLRLMVRGLLTLEKFPVALEGSGIETLARWPPDGRRAVVLLDLGDGTGPWREAIATSVRERSDLRLVAVAPVGGEKLRAEAERLGAHASVGRPFSLGDLAHAVDSAANDPSTPS